MDFYICSQCGHPENPHNFRHKFTKTNFGRIGSTFCLDALSFTLKRNSKCSVPNCNALKSLHQTKILDHVYTPIDYEYREIKFSVPEQTICKKCSFSLKEHQNVMTHSFTIGVNISNLGENDKILPFYTEDEDRKILII